VDLEAWATVRMTLDYDVHEKIFTPRVTYKHQSHRTIKAWYSDALNVITFGWYHAIVDVVIDDVIADKIANALVINMRGSDMLTNLGGIVGNAVERMQFSGNFIDDNGNFVFKLSEYM
jgi:hypothetical protein